MPRNGDETYEISDEELEFFDGDHEEVALDDEPDAKFSMKSPNADYGHISSLGSVTFGPSNLPELMAEYSSARAKWLKDKRRGKDTPEPDSWRKEREWGQKINFHPDSIDDIVPTELWVADTVEFILYGTIEVHASLVHASRDGFSRFSMRRVSTEIRECLRKNYRQEQEKRNKEQAEALLAIDPDYIKHKNADGTVAEEEWRIPDEEWKLILASFNKALPLMTDWAAASFCHESLFWSSLIAANMDGIEKLQEGMKESRMGFTLKKRKKSEPEKEPDIHDRIRQERERKREQQRLAAKSSTEQGDGDDPFK